MNKQIETCVVVDVMLALGSSISIVIGKKRKTFRDVAVEFCKSIKDKISSVHATRIDFVFDSYFQKSIKSSERIRRCKSECIEVNLIDEKTSLPNDANKFWGSSNNKILLQKFLRSYIEKNESLFPGVNLMFSTINDMACTNSNLDDTDFFFKILNRIDIEEADLKIILHIKHSVMQGFKNVYVLSCDTDVIVLVLYFWTTLHEHGLQVW